MLPIPFAVKNNINLLFLLCFSWAQLYFIAWYLISVILIINLFVALILEVRAPLFLNCGRFFCLFVIYMIIEMQSRCYAEGS